METKANGTANSIWLKSLQRDSPIGSSPTELLRSIFVHAYLNSGRIFTRKHTACLVPNDGITECFCTDEDKTWKSEWQSDNLTDPLLFPYPLAAVCWLWRNVMESMPVFWTRIVAFVDWPPSPLSRIHKQLRLSKDRDLDVFVQMREDRIWDNPGEHERCRNIIDVVMPHLHRCRLISFEVLYTSSLPSISLDFHGFAPSLMHLVLNAHIDDGIPTNPPSQVTLPLTTQEPFHCPHLTTIDVDGRNFAYACLDLPSWRVSLQAARYVRISTFHPQPFTKDPQFSLDDFLAFIEGLPRLYGLNLFDLEFVYDDLLHLNHPYAVSLSSLDVALLTGDFLANIWDGAVFTDMLFLGINDCELTDITPPADCNVTLRNIEENLHSFLYAYSGLSLKIIACPGFDDFALSALGLEWDWGVDLVIEDCEGFSVHGLIDMIQEVGDESSEDDKDDSSWYAEKLSVSGWGPCAPSMEEWIWLEQHVRDFNWDAKERPRVVGGVFQN